MSIAALSSSLHMMVVARSDLTQPTKFLFVILAYHGTGFSESGSHLNGFRFLFTVIVACGASVALYVVA